MTSDQPSLLVLAAGMGSRYGGLKQLDPVGPSGETLMDYSIYDGKDEEQTDDQEVPIGIEHLGISFRGTGPPRSFGRKQHP